MFGKEYVYLGKALPDSYSADYSNLGNVFLGHIVEDGVVKKSYVCGIEKGEVFCLDGDGQKDLYDKNKKIAMSILNKDKCVIMDEYNSSDCYGDDITVTISNMGALISDNQYYCSISYSYYDSFSYCKE